MFFLVFLYLRIRSITLVHLILDLRDQSSTTIYEAVVQVEVSPLEVLAAPNPNCSAVNYSRSKTAMKKITFSALPAELHVSIAKHCENNDLINLCLTSKLVNERCLHVLYRHVNLQFDRYASYGVNVHDYRQILDVLLKKHHQFARTLLSHPEYGKHVRVLKQSLYIPIFEGWGHAMQSLTHVQSVDLGFRDFPDFVTVPAWQFSISLFQSATTVRLVGEIEYSLATSILQAINPATLEHLCLDLVPDVGIGRPRARFEPGNRIEAGRIIIRSIKSGLLTPLIGTCTALRTLILRKVGPIPFEPDCFTADEDSLYTEWASFIRSVQPTLQTFHFEHVADPLHPSRSASSSPPATYSLMDATFRRLLWLPILAGPWPCLSRIHLRGVHNAIAKPGNPALELELVKELRAVLGANAVIVAEGRARSAHHIPGSCLWD